MAFNHLYCLITMEKSSSSANKNHQQHPMEFFALILVLWFHKFLTLVRGFNYFFSRFWSVFQYQAESFNSGNWDEKRQDSEFFSRQACLNIKKDDESLSREEVETVMRELTLFCSPEADQELPLQLGSSELSRLFEEKEPSLEEVKEAFDVFDLNKDGFIDASDLQRVLCILGLKAEIELENCSKMIKSFDENGDGRIDFKEFVKFMENSFVES